MNAERLLALYDRVAEAPDAIPRLRRFVLDLAVRGKLVAQEPADEPASELLKRITAEKMRLVKAGEIKKSKSFRPLDADDVPFELPEGWAWSRIGEVCSKTGSGSTPRGGKEAYKKAGIPFLRSQNVYDDGLRLNDVAYIDPETHEKMSGTKVLAGDLLLNITGGSIGRCCRVQDDFEGANVSQHVSILRPVVTGMAEFLHRLILSPYFQAFIFDEQTGAGRGGLPKNRMDNIAIALPPLAEQRRIVKKAEELMALLDRLEAARNAREATRDRLTAASLARLTAPDTSAKTFRTHARFTLDALPALTTRSEQIKALRQTILDLVVRGRLVEQDPADEPALELLNAVRKKRENLYAEKKIPKPKALPPIAEMDLPFDVPSGWAWSMLGELCYQVADGPHFSPQYVPPGEGVPFLSTRNVRPEGFDLSSLKYVSWSDHEEFCKRIKPELGDILYTKGGTTGIAKVNNLDFEFSVWVHLAVLRIEKQRLYPRYVELALNSPHCYAQSQEYTRGISNFDLGLTRMIKITVPLPPLAEQHRIVAKVDALMALCDRLETSLATSDTTRARLLDALLHEALTPAEERDEAA